MNIDKVILTLTEDEHHTLLDIFGFYIESNSVSTGHDMRVIGDTGLSREYSLVKKYLQKTVGRFRWKLIFDQWVKERKEHIEWLFGSDNDGEPEFRMPKDYAEMKEFLTIYDMDYLPSCTPFDR